MTALQRLLPSLNRADATAPRVTFYDDATGERIELSAKVLSNWAAKAANALVEEFDAALGTTVGLVLPLHWRAFYWALAAWDLGATVVVGPGADDADVVVTDDAAVASEAVDEGRYAVLVTLAALARSRPDTPSGAMDEARELATFGDAFVGDPADDDDIALVTGARDTAYREVVDPHAFEPGARVRVPAELGAALRCAVSVWSRDGSVVIIRNAVGDQASRLAAERVTLDLS